LRLAYFAAKVKPTLEPRAGSRRNGGNQIAVW